MNLITKLFKRRFTDAEIEEKIQVRVRELFSDLINKGIIDINEGFTWKVECNQDKNILKIFHNEAMSAVNNMLDEINVTTMIIEKEVTK